MIFVNKNIVSDSTVQAAWHEMSFGSLRLLIRIHDPG